MTAPAFGDWLHPDDERFWNPEEYNPRHWMIRNKEGGGLVPFGLRSEQRLMSNAARQAYEDRLWLAVVKPRKMGSSTFWTGIITQHTMHREGCYSAIVAQRTSVAQEIAGIAMRMYKHNKSPWAPRSLPGLKRSLEFPEIDSKLDIGSVGQDDVARGSTGLQAVLATEICKWGPNAPEQWASLLANVPHRAGFVVGESTPHHHGDALHQLIDQARDSHSPWMSLFIPWTDVVDYRIQPPDKWAPSSLVTDYAHQHSLSDAQAYWMSVKGLPDCAGRLDLFRVEYPVDIVDCWLPGGDALFDMGVLTQQRELLLDANAGVSEKVEWVYWEDPTDEAEDNDCRTDRYVIAVDPAGSFSKGDFWGVQLWNLTKCRQAGEFLGHANAAVLGKDLAALGKKYNNANIYVELNGVGEALLVHLIHTVMYPYIFFRRARTGAASPGWHANTKSKTEAVGFAQELIRDESVQIRSLRLLDQLINYRGQWEKLSRDSQGGHFDLAASFFLFCWAYINEGGSRRPHSSPTTSDWRSKVLNERRALDGILGGESTGGRDTPWGTQV